MLIAAAAAAAAAACVQLLRITATARLGGVASRPGRQAFDAAVWLLLSCTLSDWVFIQVLESSREAGEPLSFEIGAGDITGNPLFQVGPDSAAADHFACLLTWLGYNPSTLPVNG
jgi:hypothetical protein